MAGQRSCFNGVADEVFSEHGKLSRLIGAKWSKSVSKRAAKTRVDDRLFQEVPAPVEEAGLRQDGRKYRQELEKKEDELRWLRRALADAPARYFELYDLAPPAYFTLSAQGLILEANPAAALQLGVAAKALINRPLTSFIWCEGDDLYCQQWRQLLDPALVGPQVIECKMRRGKAAPLAVRLKAIATQAWNGALVYAVGMTDIEARKLSAAEASGPGGDRGEVTPAQTLEAEIIKSRNLESLGHLAGGIAHDFNNLFQGLLGNISLAKMCLPPESEAVKYLNAAEGVHGQATKLTSQLIAFSPGGEPRRLEVQLEPYIRQTVTANLSGSKLTAAFDLAADLWPAKVDPSQFTQVMDNLVANAREAMPLAGTIVVRAANAKLPLADKPTTLPLGNYVQISIRDQGVGISEVDLPRIFDPYFSTKQRGAQKGMGLGLTLCNTIIQKNGGAITVETEPEQGSTFHVYLPAVTLAPKKTGSRHKPTGHGPRILIMDDEPEVSEVASKYLSVHGYRVDSAANGDAALAAYQGALEHDDPYTAVILDLTIPGGMGGEEVFARLKATDPEVQAIVSSGYTAAPVMLDYAAHGFVEVLVKPYQLSAMKEVLDRLV